MNEIETLIGKREINDMCMCGRKISGKLTTHALSRSWHDKCFRLYKRAYQDGYNKVYGRVGLITMNTMLKDI